MDYFDVPAFNHSCLVDYKFKGLSEFWLRCPFNPNKIEDKNSDALLMGTLLHQLLLEPEKDKDIVVADYGISIKNKAYEKVVRENEGKLVVNPDMFSKATKSIQTLIDSKVWKNLLKDCKIISREEPIYFDFFAVPCKIKPDMLLQRADGSYLILDYKSTDDTMKALKWSETLGYDIESTLYRNGVALHYGVDIDKVDFVFLFQDKRDDRIITPVRYSYDHELYAAEWLKDTLIYLSEKLAEYSQTKDELIFLQPNNEVLEFITVDKKLGGIND